MKIKKNIYHILFFDFFFEIISIILISLSFFLGFELSMSNLLIYLLITLSTIIVGILIYFVYASICKTYYEFTYNSILINRKGMIVKTINSNQIKSCEYYRFYHLLLGNPKGGKLVIYYLDDGIEKIIEISFLEKLTKKISIKNIYIK